MLDAQLLSAKTGEGMGPAVKVGLPTTYYSTTLLRYYSTTLLLSYSTTLLLYYDISLRLYYATTLVP